jgi:hypothetical protein
VKINNVFGAGIVLAALWSSAHAKPLQEAEKKFLMEAIKAGVIAQHCPGFVLIEKSTIRLGDRYGVDGQRLTDALNEAIRLMNMQTYDRRKLIPEVTQELESWGDIVRHQIERDPKVCSSASETSQYLGLLRR